VVSDGYRLNPLGWFLVAVGIGTPANFLWRIHVVESIAYDQYLYWLLQVPGILLCGIVATGAAERIITRLHAPAAGGVRG
jgi:hypothetical protein